MLIMSMPNLKTSITAEILTSLKVQECRTYRGPHLYSHTPMIRIQVNLGILEEWPTNKLENFTEKLLAILPGLSLHTCSIGEVGGFVSRLKDGTWIGHVIEHVAIELQTMADMPVTRGKTRSVKGKPGFYNIMYAYMYEEAGLLAGRLALDLVASILNEPFNKFSGLDKVHDFNFENGFDIQKAIAELKAIHKAEKFGPTTQAIIDEAERRGIPWKRIDKSMVQLGNGKYQKTIRGSITSNTSNIAVDFTDEIHPDNALIAKRAALTLGLDIAGIDMILPDIEKSWIETGGGIIEVNASPGFRMHLHPSVGVARNVAKPVVSALFPPGEKTRIPLIGVTGTNGKSTTVRMIAHIFCQAGMRVGYVSTSGIYINNDCVWKGDASGPKSAGFLIKDPTIDVAILETARGGILREGLGVMELDAGAVLNVTADHLGIGGIDTLEDLAAVKSVVTETVHRDGVSVINADDPMTVSIAKYAGGNLCYFSMQSAKSELIRKHLENGGSAVTREVINKKAQIVLNKNGERIPIIKVNDIPATHNGVAVFNIENALAATAIASGLNIDPKFIKLGLNSFVSSYDQNPGRFNIYDEHGFRIIVDYAHNPAALKAFFNMIKEMRKNYLRVIGHISTPGDRRDDDIREVGRIAAKEMDLVIFREKPDNRGRPDGEVVRLLKEGALSAGCPEENIICVLGEEEATTICLQTAQLGDLVILTPSDIEGTWKQVEEFKPDFNQKNKLIKNKEKANVRI